MSKVESSEEAVSSGTASGSPARMGADASPAGGAAAPGGNLQMMGKLLVLVLLMFTFGWAMIPIYNAICEATGIRVLTKRDDGAEELARNTQVDTTRTIRVEFDSNNRGAWHLKPRHASLDVHPGELVTIEYELTNAQDHPIAGQAIPSYAPLPAGLHFHKLECFCFTQQELKAGEKRTFPVVFVIDRKLPADINTITLSYTMFEVGKQAAVAADNR